LGGELLEKAHLHPIGPDLEKSLKRTASRLDFNDVSSSLYRFVRRIIFVNLMYLPNIQIEDKK